MQDIADDAKDPALTDALLIFFVLLYNKITYALW